jgi:predicted secreted protein
MGHAGGFSMLRAVLSLSLAGLVLSGCTRPETNPVTNLPDGMFYAGAEQDGGAVTLQVGQTLRIELESIPTAGYVWEIENQPDFLELVDEATRPTNPEFQNQPGVTGGNHFMAFDLKATATGKGTINMIDHRPWENGDERGTWHIDVTVTPAS